MMTAHSSLSETMANDPQMKVPLTPKVSEDYLKFYANNNQLLVLGGHSETAFSGRSVEILLPELMPLLNGKNSVEKIKQILSHYKESIIDEAISVFYLKGLIENAEAIPSEITLEQQKAYARALSFYSRYIDVTETTVNRYESFLQLQKSEVLVVTDNPLVQHLITPLQAMGLGKLTVVVPNDSVFNPELAKNWNNKFFTVETHLGDLHSLLDTKRYQERPPQLVLSFLKSPNAGDLLGIAEHLSTLSTRLINASIDSANIQLGPVMDYDLSTCFTCADLADKLVSEEAKGSFSTMAQEIAIQRTVHFVWSLLTKFIPITLTDSIETLNDETLKFEKKPIYKQFSCPCCSTKATDSLENNLVISTGTKQYAPLSWFYHENTNHKPYQIVPKGHQQHYSEGNKKTVSGAFKTVKNRQVFNIKKIDMLPDSFAKPFSEHITNPKSYAVTNKTTYRKVEELLMLSCGRHVESIMDGWNVGFRITPSAGSMASQTLYLYNFGIEGLPRGVYNYNPNGSLEQISENQDLTVESVRNLVIDQDNVLPANAVAAIVINEAFDRVESKYRNTAYRYTNFDAGVMLSTIMATGPLMGFDIHHTCNFYDDELSDSLLTGKLSEYPASVCFLVENNGEQHA